MATKRYIAQSHISLSVKISDTANARVTFSPVTGGTKSVFYTDNEELQKALETHPRYGKLFRVDPSFDPNPVVEKETKSESVKDKTVKKVKVTCVDDAKEYICEKYGVSRTKLNSEKAIKEFAQSKGFEFVGI